MKIRSLIILIAFVTGCFTLQNCGRPDGNCPEQQIETHNLNSQSLSKIPYTGYDTLFFLDKNGDTSIVRGTGKTFAYDEVEDFAGDCPGPKRRYQKYEINFVPVKGAFSFKIVAAERSGSITIERNIYPINFYSELGALSSADIPSAIINDKEYLNITVLLTIRRSSGFISDTTYIGWYNTTYGLLKMTSTKEQESYTIILN